jgi:PAS domain S-box-containing protein
VEKQWQSELDMIGLFITESLLKHEYATVENFLYQLVKENDDIMEIKATAPNNFVLMQYRSTAPALHVFSQEKQIGYGGTDLLVLNVVRDFTSEERILRNLQLQLIAGSIFITIILGTALWFTIRRMAFRPLEMEIEVGRRTEEMLERVKNELALKVQERTQELSDINENLLLEIEERKKAESASKESELKYRAILDNARDGILLADIEKKKFYEGNKMISQMLGYSHDEIKTLGVFDIHPEEQLPYVVEQFNKQVKKEIITAKDIPVKRKDGSIFYVDINSSIVVFDGVTYLMGIFRDVTDSRRAEKVLLTLSSRNEALLSAIPDIIMEVDNNKVYTWANKAGLLFFGDDVIGKEAAFYFEGEQKTYDIVKPLFNGGDEIVYVESWQRRHDGEKRLLAWWCRVLKDTCGNVFGALSTARDITENKNAENALRRSEEKFSKAFSSSPTLMAISILKEGRFLDVNDAFLSALGYEKEEVVGHTSLELDIWGEYADRDKMVQELKEHGVIKGFETSLRKKNREILTMLLSAEIIDMGHEPSFIAVALDITDRKKLEAQLLHAQKMEAVGQLAGGVAHDFNNILTAVINNCYLLKKSIGEDNKAGGYIEKIYSLSNNAAKITRELLIFSRKQIFEPMKVDLNDIIRNSRDLIKNFIREDIKLKTVLAEGSLPIMADRNQIEQIMMNLATNARDAIPDVGKLTIETELVEINESFIKAHGFGSPGIYALLSVTDTGTGMDEDTKQKIFEPFFTTKEVGKGTGLGLAIVYGIVNQHNGFINVYSVQEKGTTFRIYFPVIQTVIEADRSVKHSQLMGKGETILFAEDEPAVRESIKTIFEEFNYRIIVAVDGQDAVDKFLVHKDDIKLLVFDIVMPKKSGKKAFNEIREVNPGIKVIFTSGYAGDNIPEEEAEKEGIVFISKPLLPEKLLSKVKELLQ